MADIKEKNSCQRGDQNFSSNFSKQNQNVKYKLCSLFPKSDVQIFINLLKCIFFKSKDERKQAFWFENMLHAILAGSNKFPLTKKK